MAARVGSPASAMSAAAPAVSATTRDAQAVPAQEVAALAERMDVALDQLDRLQRGARDSRAADGSPARTARRRCAARRAAAGGARRPPGRPPCCRPRSWHSAPARRGPPRRRPRTNGRAGRAAPGTPAGRPCASRRRAGPGTAMSSGRCAGVGRGHARRSRMRRAFSRSPGVSTPNGTTSTSRTPMLMPCSSARSCSSRSRSSSGLGGRAGEALQRFAA